jgi:tetratricopeptide (TPR) repeat protein
MENTKNQSPTFRPKPQIRPLYFIIVAVIVVLAAAVAIGLLVASQNLRENTSTGTPRYDSLLADTEKKVDSGDFDTALSDVEKALNSQEDKTSDEYIRTLSLKIALMANQGDYDTAIKLMLESIDLLQDKRDIEQSYSTLSYFYGYTGDQPKRLDAVKKAKALALETGENLNIDYYNATIMEIEAAMARGDY